MISRTFGSGLSHFGVIAGQLQLTRSLWSCAIFDDSIDRSHHSWRFTRTCKDPEAAEKAAEKAAVILNDTLDPEDIPAVAKWFRKCYHRPSEGELKMATLDAVLEGFGVEAIRVEGEWVSHYHGDLVASYVNQGDTYTLTVVHDHESESRARARGGGGREIGSAELVIRDFILRIVGLCVPVPSDLSYKMSMTPMPLMYRRILLRGGQ